MGWKEELAAKSDLFGKRLAEKMPQTDDLTLIVLKGHLLIEEWINSTIDGLLPNPQALKAARLDCFQRTRLLMAMFGHVLEPPQIEDRIAAFIDSVESQMEPQLKAEELPQAKRLSRAICFLSGQLSALGRLYIGVSKFMSLNADYGEAST